MTVAALDPVVEISLAITAVLAALGAIIHAAKKTRAWWRDVVKPFLGKVDAVLDLASYELQHNGGGSIKDSVARIGPLEEKVDEHIAQSHEMAAAGRVAQAGIEARLVELESHQIDTVAHLAEALPVVARAVPHPQDAHLPISPDQEAS